MYRICTRRVGFVLVMFHFCNFPFDFLLDSQDRAVESWVKTAQLSVKSDFRFESFKRKFSSIRFDHNLMIGCPTKNKGNYSKKAIEQRFRNPDKNSTLG